MYTNVYQKNSKKVFVNKLYRKLGILVSSVSPCAARRGSSGRPVHAEGGVSAPGRTDGQSAAAGRFDSGPAQIYCEDVMKMADNFKITYEIVPTDEEVVPKANKDFVPVVRCKDCKHYDSETQSCLDGLDGIFQPEWYCADGERR